MAKRWVRGPTPTRDTGAANYYQVAIPMLVLLYYTLRYLLNYAFIEDGIAAGGNFTDCTDDTGTDGVLSNSNFNFTSATANWVSGDIGKMILISDSTNPENCGIYEIKSINSTTSVVIDFYSTDKPTAATGLTWYQIDVTAISGAVSDDFFVFQCNHATVPWQVAVTLKSYGGDDRAKFEFAPEAASWSTSTHAWKTTAPVHSREVIPCMGNGLDATCPRLYVYGDTDGSALWVMMHRLDGTSDKSYVNAFVVNPLFETSPTHSARDKLATFGTIGGVGGSGARNGHTNNGIGLGSVWVEDPYTKSTNCRWCGWYDTQEYFKRAFTSPNHRDGTDFDGLPIWVQADADISENPQFSVLGSLPTAHIFLTACKGIGDLTLFGSEAYMHWIDGIVTPWPGIQHT